MVQVKRPGSTPSNFTRSFWIISVQGIPASIGLLSLDKSLLIARECGPIPEPRVGFDSLPSLRDADDSCLVQKLDWIARTAGWRSSTSIPIIYALMALREQNGISVRSLQGAPEICERALRRRFLEHDAKKSGPVFCEYERFPRLAKRKAISA